VEAHLDRRSLKLNRRPGHDKKERIDAAAQILAEKKGSSSKAAAPLSPIVEQSPTGQQPLARTPAIDAPPPPRRTWVPLALAAVGAVAAAAVSVRRP
jgi:hypothetical protein